MTTAFKNWHNLAVGAVLLGLNVFLVSSANSFLTTSQTLQGWATMVIAGYAFIAAIYLGVSPLGENSTLTEAFPGVFDHFKAFIVGGLFYHRRSLHARGRARRSLCCLHPYKEQVRNTQLRIGIPLFGTVFPQRANPVPASK